MDKLYKCINDKLECDSSKSSFSIMSVTDGVNVNSGNTVSVATVDTTAPTSASFTTSSATNSIKVVASGTDSESGIYGYQFSKDGEEQIGQIFQTGNTYTNSGLTSGKLIILKVRALIILMETWWKII